MFADMETTTIKKRRSKYNFKSFHIGSSTSLPGIDVQSFKNSLSGYNSRHNESLSFDYSEPIEKTGRVVATRTA
jgi:hypothetical protein